MPTLFFVHEVDGVDRWLTSPKREELMGPLGFTARTFRDSRAEEPVPGSQSSPRNELLIARGSKSRLPHQCAEPLCRSDADWCAGARARHEVGLFEAREPAIERVGE
jgi:hypothetical protein